MTEKNETNEKNKTTETTETTEATGTNAANKTTDTTATNETTAAADAADNTERVKLSQWDAIVLESVRSLGLTDEEILHRTAQGDLPASRDEAIPSFEPLLTLQAEQPEAFERAVTEGYRIKYNTLGGINTWIRIVFGREAEVERSEGIEGVASELTPDERDRLKPVLSIGWTIEPQQSGEASGEAAPYRIVPVRS